MDDSDFQTLGAASILTKKVAAWKEEPTENWSGYHIFEEAKKGDEICNRAIDEMVEHFTVQKDTAADSGSDRQHHCCLASCSRTCFILCKSGTVYIIFHFTWNSESAAVSF